MRVVRCFLIPGVREIMDFSMEWPKKNFQGANSGEIGFHQLKTKTKAFFN